MNKTGEDEKAQAAELLAAISRKDKQAFERLFLMMAPRLKSYALQQGCTNADAEEIVQEAMLTIWRKAHLFDSNKASASTWLFTIVRNKRIDFFRKGRPDLVVSDDLWPSEEPTTPEEESLEKISERDLNSKSVRNMFQSLPIDQRQVLFKVYFEGKSHGEIADEMDLPLGTVKSRIRLAMNKLEVIVKEQITWLIIILPMIFS